MNEPRRRSGRHVSIRDPKDLFLVQYFFNGVISFRFLKSSVQYIDGGVRLHKCFENVYVRLFSCFRKRLENVKICMILAFVQKLSTKVHTDIFSM